MVCGRGGTTNNCATGLKKSLSKHYSSKSQSFSSLELALQSPYGESALGLEKRALGGGDADLDDSELLPLAASAPPCQPHYHIPSPLSRLSVDCSSSQRSVAGASGSAPTSRSTSSCVSSCDVSVRGGGSCCLGGGEASGLAAEASVGSSAGSGLVEQLADEMCVEFLAAQVTSMHIRRPGTGGGAHPGSGRGGRSRDQHSHAPGWSLKRASLQQQHSQR